jgi:elongation factor Ts
MTTMNITAADVNKLRKQTGAGMMDCKSALTEANGDFEVAVDILRKKGQKVAAKRSDRDATEGVVIAKTVNNGKKGVVIMLNCETDFVAKNADFNSFVENILNIAIEKNPATLEELKNLPYTSDISITDKIIEQTGVIGEKLELSVYEVINAETVVAYNHPGSRLSSMVGLNKAGNFEEMARDVAMQIAAMAPIAIDKEGVTQDTINREIEIGKELAIQEGKPVDMAEKISLGRLNKFFQENTLLNQQYVKDSKLTIKQYLASGDKDLTVTDFKRISLG